MKILNDKYPSRLLISALLMISTVQTSMAQIKDDFSDYASGSASVDTGLAVIDGEVWVWGFRGSGQAGNGIRSIERSYDSTPNKVYIPNESNISELSTLKNIKMVSGGIYHLIALDSHGVVWGWGQNIFGEVGCHYNSKTGHTNLVRRNIPNRLNKKASPMAISNAGSAGEDSADYSRTYPAFPCRVLPSGVKVVSIAGGEYHSIALDSEGRVWLWGSSIYQAKDTYEMDSQGNLILDANGLPKPINSETGVNKSPQIVRLPFNEKARLVGAAYEGAYVVTTDNKIYAWGDNENGGLGFATKRGHTVQEVVQTPVRADKIEKYASEMIYIGGGNGFGNALLRDGSVIGWGDTSYLGMGKDYYYGGKKWQRTNYFPDLSAPSIDGVYNRPILTNVTQFVSRYRGAVAVTSEGSLYLWGWGGALNANGLPSEAIGYRIYGAAPRKVTLAPGSSIVSAAAGGKEHVYYWDESGRMFGLGYNAGRNADMFNNGMPDWPGAEIPYKTFQETPTLKNANP